MRSQLQNTAKGRDFTLNTSPLRSLSPSILLPSYDSASGEKLEHLGRRLLSPLSLVRARPFLFSPHVATFCLIPSAAAAALGPPRPGQQSRLLCREEPRDKLYKSRDECDRRPTDRQIDRRRRKKEGKTASQHPSGNGRL